jgi:hypothetical protein
LGEALREDMERIAADHAIGIEFAGSQKSFRKADRVPEILVKGRERPAWCAFCRLWWERLRRQKEMLFDTFVRMRMDSAS